MTTPGAVDMLSHPTVESSSKSAKQAVILAAGRGRRLASVTDNRPKCLVEVGGCTLLQRQLRLLRRAGVERVCVVAGYQGQAVCDAAGGDADVIYNDQWSSTNSLYSLWLCRRWIQG
ncbi:MAG: NTP transferase domain-containing protein, partial [Alphaproteobacteria bacterium]|nr:NTP transferase domain-containing protein [Alphaproteobacteria bacterium]